jgi:hypothetical protein
MHHPLLHRCQLFCVAPIDGLFRPLVSAGPTDAALGATIYFSEQVVPTNAPELCCVVGTISGRAWQPTWAPSLSHPRIASIR